MKQDNRYFGQILSKLNGKVNRRSSYIHNTSLKYHSGDFSHDRVIINLKNDLYMQSPRYYMPYDIKAKSFALSSIKDNASKILVDDITMPLRAALVQFHQKSSKAKNNRFILPSKRNIIKKQIRLTRDANHNTE